MSNHGVGRAVVACPAVFTALLALTITPSAIAAGKSQCAGAGATPATSSRTVIVRAVTCEINRQRTARGLARVTLHRALNRAANRYARSMVRQKFFSHVSPSGASLSERLRAAGYIRSRWFAGEALAWGIGDRATPAAIVSAWMHSPPHRAVLLGRNYRDVGIGVALGTPMGQEMGSSATYAAQLGVTR